MFNDSTSTLREIGDVGLGMGGIRASSGRGDVVMGGGGGADAGASSSASASSGGGGVKLLSDPLVEAMVWCCVGNAFSRKKDCRA